MTKDEMKNRISMALKDPILQQGFEIICKENAELKARLFCIKETCDNCGFVKCENFQRQRKSEPCSVYISYKDRITKLKLQLIEAKAIIKDYMIIAAADHCKVCSVPEENRCINVLKLNEQAEQFLNRQGDNEND